MAVRKLATHVEEDAPIVGGPGDAKFAVTVPASQNGSGVLSFGREPARLIACFLHAR